MKLPLTVQDGHGSRFAVQRIEDYHSNNLREQVLEVVLQDYRGAYFTAFLPTQFLLSIADTIYRVCSQQPRDPSQDVRLELVNHAPAAAAVPVAGELPHLRLVDGEDIEAIKKGLLR